VTCPENIKPLQPMNIPLEAPCDGTYANLLKRFGAIFLTKESKVALLVSWMHIMLQELSSIFALIALYLPVEFNPLTFQFKIFQVLRLVLLILNIIIILAPTPHSSSGGQKQSRHNSTQVEQENILHPSSNQDR
jgi:hypothetical protein